MALRDGQWQFTVIAFIDYRTVAVETMHADKTSLRLELLAFTRRMSRGEICHIHVIDHRPKMNKHLHFHSSFELLTRWVWLYD